MIGQKITDLINEFRLLGKIPKYIIIGLNLTDEFIDEAFEIYSISTVGEPVPNSITKIGIKNYLLNGYINYQGVKVLVTYKPNVLEVV